MSPMLRRPSRGPEWSRCPGGQNGDASFAGNSDDGGCWCSGSLAHSNRVLDNGKTEKTASSKCGFSLAEALVALAIAAMMAAVLTRFVAGTRFNADHVHERLELGTISQSMLDSLPETLSPGFSSGQNGAYRWRKEITPVTPGVIAQKEASSAQGALEDQPRSKGGPVAAAPGTDWVLYRVKVQIEAPSGQQYAADTIRFSRPRTIPDKANGNRE